MTATDRLDRYNAFEWSKLHSILDMEGSGSMSNGFRRDPSHLNKSARDATVSGFFVERSTPQRGGLQHNFLRPRRPAPQVDDPGSEHQVSVGATAIDGWVPRGSISPDNDPSKGVLSVVFSGDLAAYLDPEEWEWLIVKRSTGQHVSVSSFPHSNLPYLAMACYALKSQDERGDDLDILKAERWAAQHLDGAERGDVADFQVDFDIAAMDLLDQMNP